MTVFQEHPGLLQRFRDGARDAFEVVYRRYCTDVFRLLRRGFVTGNPPTGVPPLEEDRSLELVQEVFVRAFDERARLAYDGLRPYRPYVLRIAKNLRIDVARRDRHDASESLRNPESGQIDFDEIAESSQAISPGEYENELHWKARLKATHEFLRTLPELERTFVNLRFVEEQPQLAVAAALQITRRRVRTLEERVQKQLQQYLATCGLVG